MSGWLAASQSLMMAARERIEFALNVEIIIPEIFPLLLCYAAGYFRFQLKKLFEHLVVFTSFCVKGFYPGGSDFSVFYRTFFCAVILFEHFCAV